MSVLQLTGVSKSFPGKAQPAVDSVSLDVESGEILVIVGESGCGKTTLLRLIAGLEIPSRGEIRIGERVMFDWTTVVPPERRGVGLVFQDYALFPHLTVARNIDFGIENVSRTDRARRVAELLGLVGLEGFAARYPHELSGGEQQRVALARALAPAPSLVLLDEPFSNLDAVLKQQMREEVHRILRTAGSTALFVVHDREDALTLGDRIAVLRHGAIQQIGTARALSEHPVSEYVARYLAPPNGGSVEGWKRIDASTVTPPPPF
jgi:iron(III) transport system ATP-binding protein